LTARILTAFEDMAAQQPTAIVTEIAPTIASRIDELYANQFKQNRLCTGFWLDLHLPHNALMMRKGLSVAPRWHCLWDPLPVAELVLARELNPVGTLPGARRCCGRDAGVVGVVLSIAGSHDQAWR
jgi:hypothetical protein